MPYNLLHQQTQFPLTIIFDLPHMTKNIFDNTNDNIITYQKQQSIISETEYNYLPK